VTAQAYSSKIILYFQLQNHEYFYSGVTIVLGYKQQVKAYSFKPTM